MHIVGGRSSARRERPYTNDTRKPTKAEQQAEHFESIEQQQKQST